MRRVFCFLILSFLASALAGCKQADRVAWAADYRSTSTGLWPSFAATSAPRADLRDTQQGLSLYIERMAHAVDFRSYNVCLFDLARRGCH